jgi:hypothetical protein
MLTTHFHKIQRSRIGGATPPVTLYRPMTCCLTIGIALSPFLLELGEHNTDTQTV